MVRMEKVAILPIVERKTPRILLWVKNILVCILILSFRRILKGMTVSGFILMKELALSSNNGFLGNYLIFIRGEIPWDLEEKLKHLLRLM